MNSNHPILNIIAKYEQKLNNLSVHLAWVDEKPAISKKAVQNLFKQLKQEIVSYIPSLSNDDQLLLEEYQKLGTVEELQNALELAKNLQQALQHSHSQDRDEAAIDAYLEYLRKQEELTNSSPKEISR